jgi:hypothetical protein
MNAIHKLFCKKAYRVTAVIAAIMIVLCALLHFFPVYHILDIPSDYYSRDQIAMALSIGSASDRRQAQAVLHLAEEAFSDTEHTSAENQEAYGLLARYATAIDSYGDAAWNEHTLKLWSAHLDENEGWIWVYYSSETFNSDGTTARGSWHIPSLWKVEKDNAGQWVVVQICEHA